MGATTNSKTQVSFAYLLTSLNMETTVAVVANVYFGQPANGYDHDATDTYAEIVAATLHPTPRHKMQAWENIPAVIREDMEQVAIEKAVDKMFAEAPELEYS